MSDDSEDKGLLTIELTSDEARTLVVSLAAEIKRRTAHLHAASEPKRTSIQRDLDCLQSVYDKVDAVHGTVVYRL